MDIWEDTTRRIQIALGIIIGMFILWGCYSIITYRKTISVTVTAIGWDTRIDVQRYQTNNHGGWSIPNGGRETDSYRKQRGTRSVADGTERVCSGTGKDRTCKNRTKYKQVPVYDRWYEYDIEEWTNIEPLTASGNTHEWYMPDTSDGTWNTAEYIGNKRLGLQYTHFYVKFVDRQTKKEYGADMVESMWKQYNVEDSARITLNFFNTILAIEKSVW